MEPLSEGLPVSRAGACVETCYLSRDTKSNRKSKGKPRKHFCLLQIPLLFTSLTFTSGCGLKRCTSFGSMTWKGFPLIGGLEPGGSEVLGGFSFTLEIQKLKSRNQKAPNPNHKEGLDQRGFLPFSRRKKGEVKPRGKPTPALARHTSARKTGLQGPGSSMARREMWPALASLPRGWRAAHFLASLWLFLRRWLVFPCFFQA